MPMPFKRFLLATLLSLTASVHAQEPTTMDGYRLGVGDTVQVRVYGENDLSLEVRIPSDGRIDYAFVGELQLAGRTVQELRESIHDLLEGDYLIDPRVSVVVAGYRDFYVYGEVARPGGYAWEPGLTVRKVITLAGGLRERASESKWYLVPEDGGEADRRKVSEDDPVRPGDTLTIEESFF